MSSLTIINNGASGNSQVVGFGSNINTSGSGTLSHDHSITCPSCKTINRGMFLYPLTFDDLDLAATCNQQLLHGHGNGNGKEKESSTSNSKTSNSNKTSELQNNSSSKIVNLKLETSMMMHHNDHSQQQQQQQQAGATAGQVRKRGSGYLNNDMEMMPAPIISSSAERIIDSHLRNSPILTALSGESGASSDNNVNVSADPKPVPVDTGANANANDNEGNSNVEHIHSGAVPYLVFSKSNLSTVSDFSANHEGKDSTATASKSNNNTNTVPDNDKLHFRTGRWTGAETAYVDLLIKMFDSQQLSCMPAGMKLNEFLRDLVLCKSSRLTKKYKNAKLSTRSFRSFGSNSSSSMGNMELSSSTAPSSSQPNYAQVLLSQTQQQFIDSIRSKVTRLILQFNLRKMWRIHLSNLCLQIGYNGLYSADWIKSLDELEKKVNSAETNVRRVRRRRMEVALRHDVIGNNNVIVAGTSEAITVNRTSDSTPSHGNLSTAKKRKQSTDTADINMTMPSSSNGINNVATNFTIPTSPSIPKPVKSQGRERSNSAVYFGRVGGGKSLVHNPNTIQKKKEEVANGRLVAKVSDVSISTSHNKQMHEHSIPNLSIYNPDFLNAIPNTLSAFQPLTNDNAYPNILPNTLVPIQEVVRQTNMPAEVSPPGPGPENNDDDDDFSIGIFDLDDFVSAPHPYLHDNSDDDASTSSHRSPFMSRIITYIQQEDLPFHYIDVWVPCLTSTEQSVSLTTPFAVDQKSSANNPVRLIHAGDDKRSDLTPLATMQLNEFGIYSKNYSFDCGAGMPGRVYSSSSWSWQENVQGATSQQFERKGGAKMCNIRTAVGIPIRSSKIGHIVVGLYSLLDVKEDATIANKLMLEFQQHDPQPKWSLFIDVLPKDATIPQAPTSGGTNTHSQEKFSGEAQFDGKKLRLNDAQSIASQTSDLTSTASQAKRPEGYLTEAEAATIANTLAEHMPMQENASASLSSFISLRLMLLRYPNGCADDEKKLFLIKMSYDGYRKVHKSQATIANLLVRDWDHLNASTGKTTSCESNGGVRSPWGLPMTFTDHRPSSSSTEIPLKTPIATLTPTDTTEIHQQNYITPSSGSLYPIVTSSQHANIATVPVRRDRLSSTATMISSSISEVTNATNNLVSSSSLHNDNYIQNANQSFDAASIYYSGTQ